MNKHRNKHDRQHRRLALKKETIGLLTDDLLKYVVGGGRHETASNLISKCITQCAGYA
jgi:hypothetical protein